MLTVRQIWLMAHLGLGILFVHAYATSLIPMIKPGPGPRRVTVRKASSVAMAAVAWLTVLSGTWSVYAWYREAPPVDATSTVNYPKADLIADPSTAIWHTFGMEWKEHVAWLSPFLATAVAFVVVRHRRLLDEHAGLRRSIAVLYSVAFASALVASLLGAIITKVAPNQFLKL